MDKRLLYECKLLKQIVYKVKNQLGKTVQYRRLMHVYKSLKLHLKGELVMDFKFIIEEAGISVFESLRKKFLVPVFMVLLSVYARIYYIVNEINYLPKSFIISRKLKKIIGLTEFVKKKVKENDLNKFKEIENFLESIREEVSIRKLKK